MRRVRVAQLGTSTNSHGPSVIRSLRKQSELFDVVGYALPEDEREKFPERMGAFDGLREMTVEEILNDSTIEAVTVETEEVYLTKYALLAAQHGKHIHMEKPGGTELSKFEQLIDAVKAGGRVFHTGYMYRYNPAIIELMARIKRGELGDLISVEAQMSCPHTAAVRQWLGDFPGGMMFFLGCHLIDLVLRIMGEPETIVPFNRSTGIGGVTAADNAMAVLTYLHGASFIKTNAAEIGGFARRQLVVTGSKATAEIRPLEMYGDEGLQYTEVTYYTEPDWAELGRTVRTPQFDRYDAMMAAFAAMVRGDRQNPYTYEYELTLYRTILQCCGG